MFRSLRQSSAKCINSSSSTGGSNNDSKIDGEKQRQKKKLSFKDPEVEKPRQENVASRTIDFHNSHEERDYFHKRPQNTNEVPFENEELQADKQDELAYVKASRERSRSPESHRSSERCRTRKGFEKEISSKEISFDESKTKAVEKHNAKLLSAAADDQDYLYILSPPKPEAAAMKCPVIEFVEHEQEEMRASPAKNLGPEAETMPTSARHQIQLLNYQLEQQRQQTQTAMYQIQLLKDQLEAESAARYKAQVHNHQLMLKNKELLDHIQKLFQQVQNLEKKVEKLENSGTTHDSRQVQGGHDGHGLNQLSYRRNSGSAQSLWHNPGLFSSSYGTGRRGSGTNANAQQAEAVDSSTKLTDTGKRLSIKEDTLLKYTSPFDSDWKIKRRGSSSSYSTLDFPRIKSNVQSGNEGYNGLRNQSGSSTESKPQTTFSQRRSESVSGLDKANRRTYVIDDALLIGDSLVNDRSSAVVSDHGSANGRHLEKTEIKTNSFDQVPKDNKGFFASKRTLNSPGQKDSQSKLAQSLETLRLFNS